MKKFFLLLTFATFFPKNLSTIRPKTAGTLTAIAAGALSTRHYQAEKNNKEQISLALQNAGIISVIGVGLLSMTPQGRMSRAKIYTNSVRNSLVLNYENTKRLTQPCYLTLMKESTSKSFYLIFKAESDLFLLNRLTCDGQEMNKNFTMLEKLYKERDKTKLNDAVLEKIRRYNSSQKSTTEAFGNSLPPSIRGYKEEELYELKRQMKLFKDSTQAKTQK